MAITRSKTQKKLRSSKPQSQKSQSTAKIPQNLAEQKSINYANNYAEHPGDDSQRETKPFTCERIEESPSYMVSIPTDVVFMFNTSSEHHINNIRIKEELSDITTNASICENTVSKPTPSSSDIRQHQKENKSTVQSLLLSGPEKTLELAPSFENMNSESVFVKEGREKLCNVHPNLKTTSRNEETNLVRTNALLQNNSRPVTDEQELIAGQESIETEYNSFNNVQIPYIVSQEKSTRNETSDIGNITPVLYATLPNSEENLEMENFIKTTNLSHICLGACQMNLNTIDAVSHGECAVKVINLNCPTEFESTESHSRAVNLNINSTSLNMRDEISISELIMSTRLSTICHLNTKETSRELIHMRKTTSTAPLVMISLNSPRAPSSTTATNSPDSTKQNSKPADKQEELTEFNLASPPRTYSTIDEISNNLRENPPLKSTSPAATVIKDEGISPEVKRSFEYSVEHSEKVLPNKLFCSNESPPECPENESIPENSKFQSKTSEKRYHDADSQNSSKRGRRQLRKNSFTQSNYKRENRNRKEEKIDQNPGKSESEFIEINSDDESIVPQQCAFTNQKSTVASNWSKIRLSTSPEVSLANEKEDSNSESDYGWEDPPPSKQKVVTKLALEDLHPIVKEKMQTFNLGLTAEYDLNVIEAKKKDLFEAIEDSIVELSKKKLTELDNKIEQKKNNIRDEYVQQLFGTDNFRCWDNEPALSNITDARKVEPNSFVEVKATRPTKESAPTLDSNKPVFYGRIKKIETKFLGRELPPYLIDILKEEKRLISDLVIKCLMPHYHDGKIQPKNTFNKVAREISHVFYERYADETIIKNYIDDKFRTSVL